MDGKKLFKKCIKDYIENFDEYEKIPSKKKAREKAEKKAEKLREHTERVVELCEEFADTFPNDVDRKLLLDAAWLHDIARLRTDKKHNAPEMVSAVLKPLVTDWDDMEDYITDVLQIIKFHKNKFNPEKNQMECAILRFCDKLDKFKKKQKDAKKKSKKALKKVKKVFKKKYKKEYENKRERLKKFYRDHVNSYI